MQSALESDSEFDVDFGPWEMGCITAGTNLSKLIIILLNERKDRPKTIIIENITDRSLLVFIYLHPDLSI